MRKFLVSMCGTSKRHYSKEAIVAAPDDATDEEVEEAIDGRDLADALQYQEWIDDDGCPVDDDDDVETIEQGIICQGDCEECEHPDGPAILTVRRNDRGDLVYAEGEEVADAN